VADVALPWVHCCPVCAALVPAGAANAAHLDWHVETDTLGRWTYDEAMTRLLSERLLPGVSVSV
jgi:prepilin-type processing-associated H-X9-DG protein